MWIYLIPIIVKIQLGGWQNNLYIHVFSCVISFFNWVRLCIIYSFPKFCISGPSLSLWAVFDGEQYYLMEKEKKWIALYQSMNSLISASSFSHESIHCTFCKSPEELFFFLNNQQLNLGDMSGFFRLLSRIRIVGTASAALELLGLLLLEEAFEVEDASLVWPIGVDSTVKLSSVSVLLQPRIRRERPCLMSILKLKKRILLPQWIALQLLPIWARAAFYGRINQVIVPMHSSNLGLSLPFGIWVKLHFRVHSKFKNS